MFLLMLFDLILKFNLSNEAYFKGSKRSERKD